MALFIMGCLTVFILAFLVMLSIQAIRIEKILTDCVDLSESRVTHMYSA